MKGVIAAVSVLAAATLFSACSVQENMNPKIFMERLSSLDETLELDPEKFFVEGDEYEFFARGASGTEYAFKIETDAAENAAKIGAVCLDPSARNEFIGIAEKTVRVYSPEDDAAEAINALFGNGGPDEKCSYYETQRRSYSAASFDGAIYFGVESKPLCGTKKIGLTLKPNDRAGYK